MQLDAEGFYRPVIDSTKCVQCGACEKVCPWTTEVANPNVASVVPRTVAAYAEDESVRMESSSGGIFTVLAEKILDDGGVVVGVAQHSPTKFGHIIVENKVDLAKLRGSKYVQADVGGIYREVRSLLKSGKKVLFSGTPCQVVALYAVLGHAAATADLTTVDIVCHGSPSVKVFEKYIAEIEKGKSAHVLSTRFRDKRNGWRLFSMTSTLNTISGDCFQVSETLREDKFMRVFLRNICLNTSCADCKYGKLPRVADITLGDYWNIADVHPDMDDNKGTSVVLLNTDHGKALFDSVVDSVVQRESKVEYAIAGNPCIVSSSKPHPKRSEFFANLDKHSLDELIKKYCPYPSLTKRLYSRIRNVLGRLKRKIIK
jgi:coenzyme F420-reducing hydrogenase beta subunit